MRFRTTCALLFVALFLCRPSGVQCAAGPSAAAPTGNVLLLSDLHFDPLADAGLVQQLTDRPAAQWPAILASSAQTGYARSPQDTNYPLLKSALTAASQQPFDFVVVSGDSLRHDFQNAFVRAGGSPDQFPTFAAKTAVFVVDALQTAFGVPVYFALGNDDSPCGDYRMAPGSLFLATVADSLQVLAHQPEAATAFRTAGFCELPHPTLPSQEIVVLNSVLWSRSYSNCGSADTDPGGVEMRWLSGKLSDARSLGRRVVLVMHIPPGIDAYRSSQGENGGSVTPFWLDRYTDPFLDLMKRYADTVQIALAGHTHMDDFRVLGTGVNSVALRITPALSPIFGNNPAFSVLQYGLRTGAVSDIATYWLNLADDTTPPHWALEYRFSIAYGYHAVTAANLQALATRIRENPDVRRTFAGYYAASRVFPLLTSSNWPFYSCAQTQLTATDCRDCIHRLQSGLSPGKK